MGQALGWRAESCADILNGSRRCARIAAILPALLVTLTILLPPAPARAETVAVFPKSPESLAQQGKAGPTAAWTEFCERMPKECAVDTSERTVVDLTPELWDAIVRVNRQVNRAIKPMTDREHWGVVDRWDFAEDGYGDCEDYQLVKRAKLIGLGFPRRAMRMTVVIDDEDAGHAVLMVRTDRGDFILDNKRDKVLPWNRTGYTFVKREGQDSDEWVSLEGVASPIVTANR